MWITRDKEGYFDGFEFCDFIRFWKRKPKVNPGEDDYYCGILKATMDTKDFKFFFGYTPRKGSIREVEIEMRDAK